MGLTAEAVCAIMKDFFDEEAVVTKKYNDFQTKLMDVYGDMLESHKSALATLESRLDALEGKNNNAEDMKEIST